MSQPGKPVWGYNGSGRSGATASDQALRAKGMEAIGMTSVHAVTVPGALDAWEAMLKAHGRFDLARALQPAIKYAEHGFPVSQRVAWDWSRHVAKLKADPGATKHYLFDGKAPKEGDIVRLPALGADAEDDRRQRRARLLRRRDRRRHGGDGCRARLVPHRGGFRHATAATW